MQNAANTPVQIVQVLAALIVLFVIAPPLVKAIFRLRSTRAAGVGTGTSRGLSA
jgi:general nucleoside transport system permease protein